MLIFIKINICLERLDKTPDAMGLLFTRTLLFSFWANPTKKFKHKKPVEQYELQCSKPALTHWLCLPKHQACVEIEQEVGLKIWIRKFQMLQYWCSKKLHFLMLIITQKKIYVEAVKVCSMKLASVNWRCIGNRLLIVVTENWIRRKF